MTVDRTEHDNPHKPVAENPQEETRKTPEDLEDEKVAARRAALKVALLGGAAAVALAPKPAEAQLFGGGGIGAAALAAALYEAIVDGITDTIQAPIDGILEAATIGQIFDLPPAVVDLLDALFEMLGWAGDDSYTGESPEPAVERSYPTDPAAVATPDDRRALAMRKAEGIRLRALEALVSASSVAASQRGTTEQERAILEAANAEPSLIAQMRANNALVASLSSRLGTFAHQFAALATLAADPQLERSSDLQFKLWANQQIIGTEPADPAPPSPMPGG